MTNGSDLFSLTFWGIALLGVLLLTPLTSGRARRWGIAVLNLAFLVFALDSWRRMALVGGGLLALWGLLQGLSRSKRGGLWFAGVLFGGLALLTLHKLPGLSAYAPEPIGSGLARLNPLLALIGISYVFLRIVEVARVVWSKRHAVPTPIVLLNYLLPFHMLAAGPIQAYDDYLDQPEVPDALDAQGTLDAVWRIAFGLFKKFVVAYAIERVFLHGFMIRGAYTLLEMNLYALVVYLDFSAYSDIAVGIGRLLGVRTPENFDRPYLARNMIDFWERWHISLSEWVRRNLFIPLQLTLVRRSGGKHALLISSVSLGIAFFLCGLWHGFSLPFLLWGAMHGVGVMVTNLYRAWLKRRLGKGGVKLYMERRGVRLVATILTIEYVAASLVLVGWSWGVA
ncbi:MAG: MBOAT family protein [Planctomycetes bacterium]|nr:MBOAT family protein [Planctomycetota bacterium]